MSYLQRLKAMNAGKRAGSLVQELQEGPSCTFCSIDAARSEETQPAREDARAALAALLDMLYPDDPPDARRESLDALMAEPDPMRFVDDLCEMYEERAGIAEHCGGQSRQQAERVAAQATRERIGDRQ